MTHRSENRKLAARLNLSVARFYSQYSGLDDALTSKRLSKQSWSPKEIIGHLIDSASNNQQRFIRLQIVDQLVFPEYGKDNLKWVALGHYNDMDFADVLLTWKQYNLLIEKIIEEADVRCLSNCWKTGEKEITLINLMKSYVEHLEGHLDSFENTLRQLNP
jgi:hypothetical protein